MGANHPISFCKDFQGGRSFYTGLGTAAASFDADLQKHLKGAIAWAAGQSDPAYSDCGATVLKNFQQVKVTQQPNLNEPIGFDQFPDGRIIQTDRRGGVRLHNPATGTTQIIANLGDTTLPRRCASTPTPRTASTARRSTRTSPPTSGCTCTTRRRPSPTCKLSDGAIVTQTTPNETVPNVAVDAEGVGQVRRLLPALALQVRRGRQRSAPGPEHRAADPAGHQQPPGVLPRRGRHRLRQARQPVDGHRRRHAGRRHQRQRLRSRSRTSSPTSSRPFAPPTRPAARSR